MGVDLTSRVITARDFLMGSVWEDSGDELHSNRLKARESMFGQRILSGISGMLVTLDTYRPDLVWAPLAELRWSFDAPVFEGSEMDVRGRSSGAEHSIEGIIEGRAATHGHVLTGPPPQPSPPVTGRVSKGRTMTEADVELFHAWLPRGRGEVDGYVPWPLLVLTTSGLITRGKHVGDFHTVLNRAFHWTFYTRLPVEETIHCVVATVDRRPSASRPGLNVAQFRASVVSSASGDYVASVEWVMICQ